MNAIYVLTMLRICFGMFVSSIASLEKNLANSPDREISLIIDEIEILYLGCARIIHDCSIQVFDFVIVAQQQNKTFFICFRM